jgi:hypothetical protein
MELCYNDKQTLLHRLPNFELSYATVTHKKVPDNYNLGIAISSGKKYFAWFTFEKHNDVCYLMELNKEKKIQKIQKIEYPTSHTLCVGTILYGTICEELEEQKTLPPIFIVEDVCLYQGNVLKCPFGQKLGILEQLFLNHLYHKNTNIVFRLPCMWQNIHSQDKYDTLPATIKSTIGYNVHHIQYRDTTCITPYLDVFTNSKHTTLIKPVLAKYTIPEKPAFMTFSKPQYKFPAVFQVRADIQFDVYHLYAYGKNKTQVYYNLAYIPNIKTSYMMNTLFRKIRENNNLDYIEESEDEDDFENVNEDKYVDLSKSILMECMFEPKFKKWIPKRVVGTNEKVVHISML